MRKGSASAAAHGERAPVSWAKISVADFGGTGVSDCAVGNTARDTSGSNPSRSTIACGPLSHRRENLARRLQAGCRPSGRLHAQRSGRRIGLERRDDLSRALDLGRAIAPAVPRMMSPGLGGLGLPGRGCLDGRRPRRTSLSSTSTAGRVRPTRPCRANGRVLPGVHMVLAKMGPRGRSERCRDAAEAR